MYSWWSLLINLSCDEDVWYCKWDWFSNVEIQGILLNIFRSFSLIIKTVLNSVSCFLKFSEILFGNSGF